MGLTRLGAGEIFRQLRDDAGLTLEAVAEETGISVRTIQRLEAGDAENPTSAVLGVLLKVLDASVDEQHTLLRVYAGL